MEENKSLDPNAMEQNNAAAEGNNEVENNKTEAPVEAAATATVGNTKPLQQQLLEAGVHFGHQRKKWNPRMLPYIFTEKNGIHIIDLNRTIEGLQDAAAAMKSIVRSGKKIMFVATKKQAKEIVTEAAKVAHMPYVTERWQGGMLTNFATIRRSVKKMQHIEKMLTDGTLDSVTKKEKLTLNRNREKMEKVLGGISQMGRTPSAIFIVDISHEHIALKEARKLGITTFAMVDTNSDPNLVDFPIPSNDDATKSISVITNYLVSAINDGLLERAHDKELAAQEEEEEVDLTDDMRNLQITEDDEIDEENRINKEKKTRRRVTTGGNSGKGGRKPAQKHTDN